MVKQAELTTDEYYALDVTETEKSSAVSSSQGVGREKVENESIQTCATARLRLRAVGDCR